MNFREEDRPWLEAMDMLNKNWIYSVLTSMNNLNFSHDVKKSLIEESQKHLKQISTLAFEDKEKYFQIMTLFLKGEEYSTLMKEVGLN